MEKTVEKRYLSIYGSHRIEVEPGAVRTGFAGQPILEAPKFINFRPIFGSALGEQLTDDPQVQKTLEGHRLFGKKPREGEIWEDIAYFSFKVTAKLLKEHREGLGWGHKETGEFLGYSGGLMEAVEKGEVFVDKSGKITDQDFLKALRKKEFFEQEPMQGDKKPKEGDQNDSPTGGA